MSDVVFKNASCKDGYLYCYIRNVNMRLLGVELDGAFMVSVVFVIVVGIVDDRCDIARYRKWELGDFC